MAIISPKAKISTDMEVSRMRAHSLTLNSKLRCCLIGNWFPPEFLPVN